MNVSSALSLTIFVLTVITVAAAVLSFLIFKARERNRKPPARTNAAELAFFVEYFPPGMKALNEAVTLTSFSRPASIWRYVSATGGLLGVGCVFFCFNHWGSASNEPTEHSGYASSVQTKPRPETMRPAPPALQLVRHPPSLFPFAKADHNRDGVIQPDERQHLHRTVPQFIIVSSDDNGSVEGLMWMKRELSRRKLWSKMTFFLTGNYLSGRKNYMGGPVDKWWQTVLEDAFIGIHGTTHAPGAEGWGVSRWSVEHATVQDEIRKRLSLPDGWSWDSYPWGSRAPFLMLTDEYFRALEKLSPRVVFDSSLVVHPGGATMTAPEKGTPRDLPWPFTLNTHLPDTLDPPYLPSSGRRAVITSHDIWEVPMYAWYLRPAGHEPSWQPSMDYNLWKLYGCNGRKNPKIVEDLMENLRAHYDGNRAPFHIGFHASHFKDAEICKRNTIIDLLARIDAFRRTHDKVQYISIPTLLDWIAREGQP